jgi:hypothetical protein
LASRKELLLQENKQAVKKEPHMHDSARVEERDKAMVFY